MGKEKKPRSLKEALKGKLTKKEMLHLVRAFDTLGDIAIIEIRPELKKKERIIGEALLKVNKSIKTVCKKTAPHKGVYRAEPVKIIAGKRNLTATYRESGCVFKIPLGKVYFSPRLGTERLRIANLIKKGEAVGALFAGVGPFPIVFAKNSPMEIAYAVELNPKAFELMEENIKLNKVENKIFPIKGDVKKVVPKVLKGKCTRAVMPLPKGGETFLKEAMLCIKPSGGIIHFYQFSNIEKPFDKPIKKIKKTAKEMNRKAKILKKKKVRGYAPDTVQVVIDFYVKTI